MTTEPTHNPDAARLERAYAAPAELIWQLWTTAAGLDSFWWNRVAISEAGSEASPCATFCIGGPLRPAAN